MFTEMLKSLEPLIPFNQTSLVDLKEAIISSNENKSCLFLETSVENLYPLKFVLKQIVTDLKLNYSFTGIEEMVNPIRTSGFEIVVVNLKSMRFYDDYVKHLKAFEEWKNKIDSKKCLIIFYTSTDWVERNKKYAESLMNKCIKVPLR